MRNSLLREAVLDPINIVVVVLLLLMIGPTESVFPLLMAMAWEVGYLLLAPNSAWFRHRVQAKQQFWDETKRVEERQSLRTKLSADQERRYERLRRLAKEIHAAAGKPSDPTADLLATDLSGLDALVHSFLELQVMRRQYSERAAEFQPERLDQEIEKLDRKLQAEQDDGVRRILQQNRELVEKRRTMGGRVGANLRMLDAQLDAIENAVQLLADTVIATKASPGALAGELEGLVAQVEVTEQLLRETAPALEEMQRILGRARMGG